MLLKHRPPGIESQPATLRDGLEHLQQSSIAVLRWLQANKVEFVLVGPVARAIRGDRAAAGPVAIVPAPYGRNFDRLCQALVAEHAGLRAERGLPGSVARPEAVPVKLTPDKLARGKRWMLHFGAYDLDIEGSGGRARPSYQELLYETRRFELAEGLAVEVACAEDLEYYSSDRPAGDAPEFRVTRRALTEPG